MLWIEAFGTKMGRQNQGLEVIRYLYSLQNNSFIILKMLTLLVTLFISCSSLTAMKNFNSGTVTFDTSPYFQKSNTMITAVKFNTTFLSALDPGYKLLTSIQSLNTNLVSANRSLGFQVSVSQALTTYLQYAVDSSNANLMKTLVVRYLICSPTFGSNSPISYVNPAVNVNVSSSSPYLQTISTVSDTFTANFTDGVLNLYFLTGFTAIEYGSYFSLIFSFDRKANGNLIVSVTSKAPTDTQLISYSISLWSINIGEITDLKAKLTTGTISGSQGLLLYTDAGKILTGQNAIVGLAGFQTSNTLNFSYSISITPDGSISATSDSSYDYFQFTYAILQGPTCHAVARFYLASQQLCYDACPTGYTANSTTSLCDTNTAHSNQLVAANSSNSSSNSSNSSSNSTSTSDSPDQTQTNTIIAIIVGSVVGVIVLVVVIVKCTNCCENCNKKNQLEGGDKEQRKHQLTKWRMSPLIVANWNNASVAFRTVGNQEKRRVSASVDNAKQLTPD